ncbi:MAG: TonB-dependent receptor [Xanthomonadales bacterium]|nr:TonB-dependent receptor [Xanthomonadales bacterium]
MSNHDRWLCRAPAKSCLLAAMMLAATTSYSEVIEEILVTAQKREATLQQTPVAVTAVTRNEIELRNLDDFAQIQHVVPGLVFAEIADMAQMSMRGVGVDISSIDAEPGIALYSDGVYRGGLTTSSSLFFDLERIEALRGPQGTLFGRNSTGGALNVVTRLPGADPAVDASVLLGNYGRIRAELSGDAPLVPGVLTVRGALGYDNRDGYADNTLTGQEEDDAEAVFAKIAAVIDATENIGVTLRAEFTDSEIGGPPYLKTNETPVPPLFLSTSNPGGILSIPGTFCGALSCEEALGLSLSPPGTGSTDPRELFSDGTTLFDRESVGLSATINVSLTDELTLKSITSYFDIDQIGTQSNFDGVDIAFLEGYFQQGNEEWSQELTLSGSTSRLEWITGLYYYDSRIDGAFQFEFPALQPTFEALFGLLGGGGPLPPGSLVAFGNRADGSTSAVPFLDLQLHQDLESVAVYGQGSYRITDRLRGTLGARWTEDKKTAVQTIGNNIGSAACRDFPLDDSWSEVTGYAGFDMDVGESTLLFSSVSTGFKAGGFNGGSCDNRYDPENLTAFELGTKSSFLEDTLHLNLTLFHYDYKDLQARLLVNNAALVQNATDAQTQGVELEWRWHISDAFRVDGWVSYLDAEFEEFVATDPLLPQVGVDCNPMTGLDCMQDLSGNEMLRAPKLKASVTAEYDFGLKSGDQITLRGEFTHTDDLYHTVFNNDFARQDGYSLANARVIWTPGNSILDGLRVIAFVENLSDKEYISIHTPTATVGGTISTFGPPRTYGLQLRFSY